MTERDATPDRSPVSDAEKLRQVTFELAYAQLRIRKLEDCIRVLADHLTREGGWSKPIGEELKAALR